MTAIGVDIGGTTTKVALVRPGGEILNISSFSTDCGSPEELAARTIEAAEAIRGDAIGFGVAVAGFIDREHSRLAYNPNLPWLVGYPLREAFVRAIDLPVILEVDSNAACLAEFQYGAGRGARTFLCVAAGTGLGGSVIVDGELLRFAHECSGDLGHVIVQPDGPLCTCGGRGCAEALVSADAVVERARAAGLEAATLRDLIDAARAGNSTARATLSETGRWLGLAIASLANIFFPDRIAIAGGLAEAGDLVLQHAEAAFRSTASEFAHSGTLFAKATLGWRATVVGAACPFLR